MNRYSIFLDESGEHGLVNINEDFPVFVLCGFLIEDNNYEKVRTEINQIKNELWDDKKVIFHSRDIRKCEKEFVVLFDNVKKERFYSFLNSVFSTNEYYLVASAINKLNYVIKYGKLGNDVYEIALSFLVEKTMEILIEKYNDDFELRMIIEKRGKKEDQQLSEHLQKIKIRGSSKITAECYSKHIKEISFKQKTENINGLQLADLAAYPIARYVIDKDRANPAFDILKEKIYNKKGYLEGIIIYP